MLDMDGTILDLAFDSYVWKELVVGRYAEHNDLEYQVARDRLYAKYMSIQGDLEWYCLDHWSEHLGFDVLALHREVRERIEYLPGAREFLEVVHKADVRVLLVTNSHPDTLALKEEALGFGAYFDGIYSSHTYGHAKESQEFWRALQDEESFDPGSTVFVDDTIPVLRSARDYGIRQPIVITHPDTSEPPRENGEFPGVASVRELI
jgi:HAD superfamily hydrolase (TIGR01509 family)